MDDVKQCHYCVETINSKALICKHCNNIQGDGSGETKGKFVKVCLKSKDKVYYGDIFLKQPLERISDVINSPNHFILLANTREETRSSEKIIGFLAINKSVVEWVRLMGE